MPVMPRVVWLGLLLVVQGCSPSGWDAEVCAETNLELIDRAIVEAYAIEPYMDDMLARRFDSSYPSYGQVIETLVDYRSRDAIYCGTPTAAAMAAENQGALFAVHSTGRHWRESLELWELGQPYGELETAEVEWRIALASDRTYGDLRDQAEAYLTAPAYPLRLLSHEAAHWSIKDCCQHQRGVSMTERGGCDFVDTVGWLAPYGVLWERWRPEQQWLDQVHAATRDQPPKSEL